jgi:mRNA interferase RelE/StbE
LRKRLKNNPRPRSSKKLSDGKYRIRRGDYRVIYTIENKIITVTVTAAGHRKYIYSMLGISVFLLFIYKYLI